MSMMRVAAAMVVVAVLGGCGSSSVPGRLPVSSGSSAASTPSTPSTPSSPSSPGAPSNSAPAGTTDSDLSFDVDGTTTYGTLEMPKHAAGQRPAAALLLPGSGPNDRNGNEVAEHDTPYTLQLIADLLAKQGIASFRFDKYFTGRTGGGRFASDPAAITITDDLRMADAAYAFLARQAQIDPSKLLVVGHSEGGMIALQVATTAARKPAGLALLEPQDARIIDLIRIQYDEAIDALVSQGTISSARGRTDGTAVARAATQFRSTGRADTQGLSPEVTRLMSGLLINNAQPKYLQTWDTVRPVVLARSVGSGTRVLVTSGTRDTNVPPATLPPLARALTTAGTTGPGLVTVQGADHLMHLSSQPDTQAVLAPAIEKAIEDWAQPYAS